jgi:hypothetical protein
MILKSFLKVIVLLSTTVYRKSVISSNVGKLKIIFSQLEGTLELDLNSGTTYKKN